MKGLEVAATFNSKDHARLVSIDTSTNQRHTSVSLSIS